MIIIIYSYLFVLKVHKKKIENKQQTSNSTQKLNKRISISSKTRNLATAEKARI